jgi:hypothetical protein
VPGDSANFRSEMSHDRKRIYILNDFTEYINRSAQEERELHDLVHARSAFECRAAYGLAVPWLVKKDRQMFLIGEEILICGKDRDFIPYRD